MSDAFWAAVRSEDADAIDAAIEGGVVVDVPRDRYGRSALHIATKNGLTRSVRRLVERGADPSLRDPRGHSAIDAALEEGEPTLFEALAAGGARPSLSRARRLAAVVRHPKLAPVLLEEGEAAPAPTDEERAIAERVLEEGVTPPWADASPALLHLLLDQHDWDDGAELAITVVEHPSCRPLTARLALDRAELEPTELAALAPGAPQPELWERAWAAPRKRLVAALLSRFADVVG